jgi:S-DNA-T family DNA segregation ATPase FtsK/SpoIIIE
VVLAVPRASPLRALVGAPGVLGFFDRAELGEADLAGALASFSGPGAVMIDDAELLRDCGAAGELSRLIAIGSDTGRALVLGGDAESIGMGFSGWQVEAKRARRGCLTAPTTTAEGDLIGARLSRDVLGQPPRPGHCLLHIGDGKLISVSVPTV